MVRAQTSRLLIVALVAIVLLPASVLAEGPGRTVPAAEEKSDIIVNGRSFPSWSDYFTSDYFRQNGMRCASPTTVLPFSLPEGVSGADCASNSTNPDPIYDPGSTYQIPVVVHILENAAGTQGNVSEDLVYNQIDVLNEDFQAILGSNGAPGTYTGLKFVLADADPSGTFTNGITRSNNNTWFGDGGSYWNTLSWNTNNYMNVYTNSAGGALGYVPGFPQGGIAGSAQDRVVCLWSAFGTTATPPFNLGRTMTHEVGHYFGLYHTFQSGCGTSSMPGCYSSGDTVCDTNAESNPYFGCASPRSTCGSLDPRENYMDYSDDICMNQFTQEQMRRMRCTLLNYRASLYSTIEPDQIFLDGFESGNTASWGSANTNGGNLSVTGAAAIRGSNGMQLDFTNTTSMFVVDESPTNEDRYRSRFFLDPNSLTMPANKRFKILTLFSEGTVEGGGNYRLTTLVLRYDGSDFFLRAKVHRNPGDATWAQLPWVQLDSGTNMIELEWQQASGAAASDGYLRLWVNRRPAGSATGVANGERDADFVRFGAVGGVDAGTTGSMYMDAFESRQSLYIDN